MSSKSQLSGYSYWKCKIRYSLGVPLESLWGLFSRQDVSENIIPCNTLGLAWAMEFSGAPVVSLSWEDNGGVEAIFFVLVWGEIWQGFSLAKLWPSRELWCRELGRSPKPLLGVLLENFQQKVVVGMEKKDWKRFDVPAAYPRQYSKKAYNRILVSLLYRLYKGV